MGLFDNLSGKAAQLKKKAADAVDQHSDTIEQGLDKGGSFINDKTGGKYADKVETGKDKVRDGLDSLDGTTGDDFQRSTPAPTEPAPATQPRPGSGNPPA